MKRMCVYLEDSWFGLRSNGLVQFFSVSLQGESLKRLSQSPLITPDQKKQGPFQPRLIPSDTAFSRDHTAFSYANAAFTSYGNNRNSHLLIEGGRKPSRFDLRQWIPSRNFWECSDRNRTQTRENWLRISFVQWNRNLKIVILVHK